MTWSPYSLLAALFLGLAQPPAGAAERPLTIPMVFTNEYRVPAGVTLPSEQWVMAQTVVLDGETADDFLVLAGAGALEFTKKGAGLLVVNGTVGGDLWAAGQTLEINGPVNRHLRASSQMIQVNNRVAGNLLVKANTASLETNAVVGGTARVFTDYFILRGTVEGDLVVYARKAVLDGTVRGSAVIRAQEIAILSDTVIGGDLTCETRATVVPDPQAVIRGDFALVPPAPPPHRNPMHAMLTLVFFIGAVLAGMFFLLFSPRMVVRSVLWIETFPWRTMVIGLLSLVPGSIAVLFMAVSFLGIPLALVTGGLLALGAYLGRFVAALYLARLLTGARRRRPMPLPSPRLMLLGLAFLYASSFLPDYLSQAIYLWFTIMGLGGLMMATRGAPIPILPFPPAPAAGRSDSSATP